MELLLLRATRAQEEAAILVVPAVATFDDAPSASSTGDTGLCGFPEHVRGMGRPLYSEAHAFASNEPGSGAHYGVSPHYTTE
jgi:hypothetical protein